MLLDSEIFHKFYARLFSENLFHEDLRYQTIPTTKEKRVSILTITYSCSIHLKYEFLINVFSGDLWVEILRLYES